MFKGWLKLHRSLLDNDLWLAETFTKGQAWVDLIGHANHRAASIWIRGNEIRVERGQLAWSELTMAKRWKWSRGKVRRYLGTLESRQMVVQQTSPLTTLLTICKYEVYQGGDTTDETADGTSSRTADSTADGQQTVHKQECNKNKNGENTDIPPKSPKGDSVNYDSWPELPDPQILKDWIAARKKAKATHSQTAINNIGKELHKAKEKGFSVNECLSEAVTRGWRGLKAEWMQNAQGQRFNGNGQPAISYDQNDTSWADDFNPNGGDFDGLV